MFEMENVSHMSLETKMMSKNISLFSDKEQFLIYNDRKEKNTSNFTMRQAAILYFYLININQDIINRINLNSRPADDALDTHFKLHLITPSFWRLCHLISFNLDLIYVIIDFQPDSCWC